VSFVCLCYYVVINFKERKNKMENYKQIAGELGVNAEEVRELMARACVDW
jgi:hypothetical protein